MEKSSLLLLINPKDCLTAESSQLRPKRWTRQNDQWTCAVLVRCRCSNTQHRESSNKASAKRALEPQLPQRVCLLRRGWLMSRQSRQSIKAGVQGKRVSVRPYYVRTTVMDCLGATVGASHSSVQISGRLLEQPHDVSKTHLSLSLHMKLSVWVVLPFACKLCLSEGSHWEKISPLGAEWCHSVPGKIDSGKKSYAKSSL